MRIRGGGEVRPLVLGHRGASSDAPENTLAAFRAAIDQGADGVELDVWRCASGEIVVHHDADTRRTSGTPLSIRSTSFDQLRKLDVGAWKAEQFRGERIPTLREVLAELPASIVNVELKSSGFPDLALAVEVVRVVRQAGAQDRCLASSFQYALLAVVRVVAPELACGILFPDDDRWRWREQVGSVLLRPRAVHPEATLVTADRVQRWRERGLDVNAWTADEPREIARLAGLGVSAVITNRPAVARRVVDDAARLRSR